MSTDDQRTNRIRTSDAERERVSETLRNAVTEGRLTLEEGDERLAALYKTRFRDELPGLVSDLPKSDGDVWSERAGGYRQQGAPPGAGWPGPGGPGPGWGGPGPGAPGWGGAGPWARWRFLRVVLVIFLVGGIISVAGGQFFWPIIPLLVLGFVFVRLGGPGRCGGAGNWPDRDRDPNNRPRP